MTALAEAAHDQGATTALLSASPEGRALYHSLGWSDITEAQVLRTALRSRATFGVGKSEADRREEGRGTQ